MKQLLTEELFDKLYDETDYGTERLCGNIKSFLMDYIMNFREENSDLLRDDCYGYNDFKIEIGTTIDVVYKPKYKCRFRFDCERFDVDIDKDLWINEISFNENGERILSDFEGWLCNL